MAGGVWEVPAGPLLGGATICPVTPSRALHGPTLQPESSGEMLKPRPQAEPRVNHTARAGGTGRVRPRLGRLSAAEAQPRSPDSPTRGPRCSAQFCSVSARPLLTQQLVTQPPRRAGRCPRCWRHEGKSAGCAPGVLVLRPVPCSRGRPACVLSAPPPPLLPNQTLLLLQVGGGRGASSQEPLVQFAAFTSGGNAPMATWAWPGPCRWASPRNRVQAGCFHPPAVQGAVCGAQTGSGWREGRSPLNGPV